MQAGRAVQGEVVRLVAPVVGRECRILSRRGSSTEMWSGFLLVALPVILVWLLFGLFCVLHIMTVHNAVFQGIYVRIVFLLALMSTLKWLTTLDEVLYRGATLFMALEKLIETYLLFVYLGLFTMWAWVLGDVHERLMASRATHRRFFLIKWGWGAPIASGDACLRYLRDCSAQAMLVVTIARTTTAVVVMSLGEEHRKIGKFIGVAINLVGVVALLVSVTTLFRTYRALSGGAPLALPQRQPEAGGELKGSEPAGCPAQHEVVEVKRMSIDFDDERAQLNLLSNFSPKRKFLVVKVTLWLAILFNLVLEPTFVASGRPVPHFICPNTDAATDLWCPPRFIGFISNAVNVVLVLLIIWSFSPDDLTNLPQEVKHAYSEDVPDSTAAAVRRVFHLADIWYMMARPPKCRAGLYEAAPTQVEAPGASAVPDGDAPGTDAAPDVAARDAPALHLV